MTYLLYGLNEQVCRKNLQKSEEYIELYKKGQTTEQIKLETLL